MSLPRPSRLRRALLASMALTASALLAGVTPFEGVDFEAELDAAATDAQRLLSLYGPSRGSGRCSLHGC